VGMAELPLAATHGSIQVKRRATFAQITTGS
jgi:hypothetical protein